MSDWMTEAEMWTDKADPTHPGPPSAYCNYPGYQLEGSGYWLTTWELFNDEPAWCGRRCRHCGEVRRVAYDEICDYDVSTVLIDTYHTHPYLGREPAYELMVRGWGEYGEWSDRYHTREEALREHWGVVERLRTGHHPDKNILYAAEGYEDL